MNLLLFDIDPVKPCAFCRTCKHRIAYRYTHTIISYCDKQKSNHTENGKKKIKSKNPACPMYEKEEN